MREKPLPPHAQLMSVLNPDRKYVKLKKTRNLRLRLEHLPSNLPAVPWLSFLKELKLLRDFQHAPALPIW